MKIRALFLWTVCFSCLFVSVGRIEAQISREPAKVRASGDFLKAPEVSLNNKEKSWTPGTITSIVPEKYTSANKPIFLNLPEKIAREDGFVRADCIFSDPKHAFAIGSFATKSNRTFVFRADLSDGKKPQQSELPGILKPLDISPNGKFLLVAGNNLSPLETRLPYAQIYEITENGIGRLLGTFQPMNDPDAKAVLSKKDYAKLVADQREKVKTIHPSLLEIERENLAKLVNEQKMEAAEAQYASLLNLEFGRWVDNESFILASTRYVILFNAKNAKVEYRIDRGFADAMRPSLEQTPWNGLEVSPDRRFLVLSREDELLTFEAKTGKQLGYLNYEQSQRYSKDFHPRFGPKLAFSADGTKLLSGHGKWINIWDFEKGKFLIDVYIESRFRLGDGFPPAWINRRFVMYDNSLCDLKNGIKVWQYELDRDTHFLNYCGNNGTGAPFWIALRSGISIAIAPNELGRESSARTSDNFNAQTTRFFQVDKTVKCKPPFGMNMTPGTREVTSVNTIADDIPSGPSSREILRNELGEFKIRKTDSFASAREIDLPDKNEFWNTGKPEPVQGDFNFKAFNFKLKTPPNSKGVLDAECIFSDPNIGLAAVAYRTNVKNLDPSALTIVNLKTGKNNTIQIPSNIKLFDISPNGRFLLLACDYGYDAPGADYSEVTPIVQIYEIRDDTPGRLLASYLPLEKNPSEKIDKFTLDSIDRKYKDLEKIEAKIDLADGGNAEAVLKVQRDQLRNDIDKLEHKLVLNELPSYTSGKWIDNESFVLQGNVGVMAFDAKTGTVKYRVAANNGFAMRSDRKIFVSTDTSGKLWAFDSKTGKVLGFKDRHSIKESVINEAPVDRSAFHEGRTLAFSSDGEYLCSFSYGTMIAAWDMSDGAPLGCAFCTVPCLPREKMLNWIDKRFVFDGNFLYDMKNKVVVWEFKQEQGASLIGTFGGDSANEQMLFVMKKGDNISFFKDRVVIPNVISAADKAKMEKKILFSRKDSVSVSIGLSLPGDEMNRAKEYYDKMFAEYGNKVVGSGDVQLRIGREEGKSQTQTYRTLGGGGGTETVNTGSYYIRAKLFRNGKEIWSAERMQSSALGYFVNTYGDETLQQKADKQMEMNAGTAMFTVPRIINDPNNFIPQGTAEIGMKNIR